MSRLRSGTRIVSSLKPLNNRKGRQKMRTYRKTESDPFFEPQNLKKFFSENLNINAIKCHHRRPTIRGEGVYIYVDDSTITDINLDYRHGMIRLDGLSQNFIQTPFETHLTVIDGCIAYKLEDKEERVITNGDSVVVDPNTSYSLCNLRPELTYI